MSTIRKAALNPISIFIIVLVAILISASTFTRSVARAAGTFISAPDRVDMVYDDKRRILYITSQGSVLRYSLDTDTFLTSFEPGGDLAGIDISPDGDTLAVADRTHTASDVWIHLIDLETDTITQALFTRATDEGGTFTVAYSNDGKLLITSTSEGTGGVPLRIYDPETSESTELASVERNSMIVSSGDRNFTGLAEANNSDGPFGRYRIFDGDLLRKIGSLDGTQRFNYEIGANHDATQYAVITAANAFIADADLFKQQTLGQSGGSRPIGVVYHPAEDIVYFVWSGSNELKVYDTNTFDELAAFNFIQTFGSPQAAFQEGRLKLAGDGSILFATVAGGIRYVRNYNPLAAIDQSLEVAKNAYKIITLSSTLGNGKQPSYSVLTPPSHGTLSGEAPALTYTPNLNYSGPDSFTFKVSYGRASSIGTILLDVTGINGPPSAFNKSVTVIEDLTAFIPVDGRDPENDPISVVIVTPPAHGQLGGSGLTVIYFPDPNYNGTDKFDFKLSDGLNESNKATISITVDPVNDPPVAASQTIMMTEDTQKQINPTGSDADGDGLIFNLASNPSHGTLTNSLSGWVYTPVANYIGEDSFTFKANDGKVDSPPATVVIIISPANDNPVAVADTASTKKKKTVTINVLANDSDSDGDTLTITSVTQSSMGKVEIDGSKIKYKPKTKFKGTDTFSYTISDGHGGTATATVTVTVKK
ncbi:MAG TPA: Ig-like domain-containing protein [Blastocatellia bacterium]|jgi:hypothetical protein